MPKSKVKKRHTVHFGEILRRLRLARGWTITKLAQRSGLNAGYVSLLEKGGNEPSLTTIFELAEVLNVEAAEIVREMEQARKPVALTVALPAEES